MISTVPKPSEKVWNTYKLIQTLFDYQLECRDLGRLDIQIAQTTDNNIYSMLKRERIDVKRTINDLSNQMIELMNTNN